MHCSEGLIDDRTVTRAPGISNDAALGDPCAAWLVLSPEVALGYGRSSFLGSVLAGDAYAARVVLVFVMSNHLGTATLQIVEPGTARDALERMGSAQAVICVATREFLSSFRFEGFSSSDRRGYYQTPEMRMLADAGLTVQFTGRAGDIYRAAKGMELVCEAMSRREANSLVPLGGRGDLSMADGVRIFAAKHLISERFREKLTLDGIGRACGINRGKLTRGFREMFDCSIAATISEHRLIYAGRQLTGSDKAISSIGYDAGYLNNASFARAFHRRFECTPSQFRARARESPDPNRNLLAAS